MIARAGTGWHYALADLSLILFLVTASALRLESPPAPAAPPGEPAASDRSEPLAIWRAGPGAPPLAQWLAIQAPDPRQQLTILARYAPDGEARALEGARALVAEVAGTGLAPRVVIEPGRAEMLATLAYDNPEPGLLARGLRNPDEPIALSGVRP